MKILKYLIIYFGVVLLVMILISIGTMFFVDVACEYKDIETGSCVRASCGADKISPSRFIQDPNCK